MPGAIALTPKQINKVLDLCQHMQFAHGKRTAIVMSMAAMRVTELAQVRVRDVLTPAGMIREGVFLPAAICKGGRKGRMVYFTNDTGRQILQEWVDYRLKRKWGTVIDSAEYQGLNPDSYFLLNRNGCSYSRAAKHRTLKDGTKALYRTADTLEESIRNIYHKCGLKGASSHSGRKSYATTSLFSGVPIEGYTSWAWSRGQADNTLLFRLLPEASG